MNTNTYNDKNAVKQTLIPLGIAMDYRVHWNVHRIIRDFVQNFYDSVGYEHFADEFQYEWKILKEKSVPLPCARKGTSLHIKMQTFGHAFSYEWLSYIGGSTKTGKSGYAGKYGEGFKIALLCLVKLGGNAVMSSGNWRLYPCEYMEKIDGRRIRMFGYRMEERKDDGFTTLELYGIPDSEENIRFAEEALLKFYYPENILFGARIESTDSYALYDRSDVPVPCADQETIPGVLYYKYVARGRLPFPAVIHLTEKRHDFESDRSREIFSEAVIIDAVYQLAIQLSPGASLRLLKQMKALWKETPKFKKENVADLHTWYYVICQLVRNVSSETETAKQFAAEYPPNDYAYIERISIDYGKNRLLHEAKNWFDEKNRNGKKRRLVNPIFRLLGVPSVFAEYLEKKETLYRGPCPEEVRYLELLRKCAQALLARYLSADDFPEVLISTAVCNTKEHKKSTYAEYGVSSHVETQTEKIFLKKNKKNHIRYRVSAVVLEADDLSAKAVFQKTLLKYLDACVRSYGTEKSVRSNAVLTDIGAVLYQSRHIVAKYAEQWNT